MVSVQHGWCVAIGRAQLALFVAFVAITGTQVRADVSSDELLKRLPKPPENAPVHDLAGLITPTERDQLQQRCLALREKAGAALVVVILPSLEGGQIDDFTNKLFAQWKPGNQERDDGVMLLVAVQDRKARIEVGYGLEPILPDALAGRVLDQQLFPNFKQQRYAEGLHAAVNRIAEIIERGEPAPPEQRKNGQELGWGQRILVTLFLVPFIAVGTVLFGCGLSLLVPQSKTEHTGRAKPSRDSGHLITGVFLLLFGIVFAGIPYAIGWSTASPLAPIVLTPIGLGAGGFGWWLVKNGKFTIPRSPGGRGWSSSSDGMPWIFFGGGGGGSSSSWSSGGFSSDWGGFGGGSSGGGGASGGW